MSDTKYSYYQTSVGYKVAGKTDNDILLAGGGTIATSNFAENINIVHKTGSEFINGAKHFFSEGTDYTQNSLWARGNIADGGAGISLYSDGMDVGQMRFTGDFCFVNSNNTNGKYVFSAGYKKEGSSVDYLLDGAGGHILKSAFALPKKLGTKNLLPTSQAIHFMFTDSSTNSNSSVIGEVTILNIGFFNAYNFVPLLPNISSTVVFSLELYHDSLVNMNFTLYSYYSGISNYGDTGVVEPNKWTKVYIVTSGVLPTGDSNVLLGIGSGSSPQVGTKIKYRNVQVEEGSIPSSYKPSLQERIADYNQNDATKPNYIKNKPDLSIYAPTSALSNYVTTNGVQTIDQTKTFTSSPIVPNGTIGSHAVNLNQLNGHVHTFSQITDLANYTGFDVRYYTETEVNNLLANKDNYQFWRLKVEGSNVYNINSEEEIDLTGSGGTTISDLGNGVVRINSTDTNTTYTSSSGIILLGTNFTPNYGTTTSTIAQGNDSRIINGQTAFSWGNHALQGYIRENQLNTEVQIENSEVRLVPSEYHVDPTNYDVTVNDRNRLITIIGDYNVEQYVDIRSIYSRQKYTIINLSRDRNMSVYFPGLNLYSIDPSSKVTFYITDNGEVILMDKSFAEIWT